MINLVITSRYKKYFEGDVEKVSVMTIQGRQTFMFESEPTITYSKNSDQFVIISGGYQNHEVLQIKINTAIIYFSNNKLKILVDKE